MKLAKAMEKLKFWSRKNKKNKSHSKNCHHYPLPPPPPPPPCHCHHSWPQVEPSAPPLPPWYVPDQTNTNIYQPGGPALNREYADEIAPEFGNPSYQQYLDPNPIYGVPVLAPVRREKSAGVFGCAVKMGRHLIQCLFPCFHIREVN